MEIEEEKPATPPAPIPPARVFPGQQILGGLRWQSQMRKMGMYGLFTYKKLGSFFWG